MPHVTIIGAGLAGLTAAYRLSEQGMDVQVYEARNRVGGRIFTALLNDETVELGAENLNDGDDFENIARLVKELGIETLCEKITRKQFFYDSKNLISVHQLIREKQFDPEKLKERLSDLASKSRNIKEILDAILNKEDPVYKVAATRLAANEGATIENLSPQLVDALLATLLGGSNHQAEKNVYQTTSIKGGNSVLPEKLASCLGEHLHLNMILKRVAKNHDDTFALTFLNGEKINTDILVLAIPCSLYKDICFEDNMIPMERLKDIQNVQYGTNAKILIPFSESPQEKIGLVSENVVGYFYKNSQKSFTLYCTGDASQFSDTTINRVCEQMRPIIEKGYESDSPSFAEPTCAEDKNFATYVTPVGYSWPNDPFVKGSYSYTSPGQEETFTSLVEEKGETHKVLFAPIGSNLYFAGEHTSILLEIPGTMEAACESGERVARTILSNMMATK